MVPINYLAVLLNVVIAMALGYAWYGPLFGKQWAASVGMSYADMEAAMKRNMAFSYGMMALGALIMSFVLAHSEIFAGTYMQVSGVAAGLQAGLWNWLGFIAPVLMGGVIWERKPWAWWCINAGYYFVLLMIMGVVLALWV